MADNKPVAVLRLGSLKASIWKNQNDKATWYSTTFVRSYKDGQEWKETQSFGFDDLLGLAKLTDQAHTKIWSLMNQDREAAKKRAEEGGRS